MIKVIKFNQNNIYFFGCLHYGHDKSFIYQKRGFSSIQEHDKVLTERWNNKITNNDIIFLLGDTMFGKSGKQGFLDLINSLNGKEYFIMPGNHHAGLNDLFKDIINCKDNVNSSRLDYVGRLTYNINLDKIIYLIPNYYEAIINGQFIVLSHYPILCHNQYKHGSFMLHSHVHGNLKDSLPTGRKGKILDCGPESIKEPLSLHEISQIMEEKPVWGESHHIKI